MGGEEGSTRRKEGEEGVDGKDLGGGEDVERWGGRGCVRNVCWCVGVLDDMGAIEKESLCRSI